MNKVIAFDIQSGDKGPEVAYNAAKDFLSKNSDWKIVAFALESFKRPSDAPSNFEIIYCDQVIEQDDSAMQVMRKKESTLVKALQYVIDGNASAVVSPAASGPLVTAGYIFSKTIVENIKPAFAPIYGSAKGSQKVALDVGANIDADASTLELYALMGQEYAKALGISNNPRVRLLNIGSEDSKGTPLMLETHKLLKENPKINFEGNLEANHILDEGFDVLVSDAVTGNIMVKSYEGAFTTGVNITKEAAKKSFSTKLGLGLAKKLRKDLKVFANRDKIGGALVIGLNHILIKSHGGSSEWMLVNSLNVAKKLSEANLIEKFKEQLKDENR